MKKCIACGMPLNGPDDYALGDTKKNYCKYCSRKDGTMKSYEETLEGTIPWAMKEYGITEEQARKQIPEYLKTLPAWKDKI
ncbi:MAG: zinc ribbon domain-containing protein [Christensenellaceae bacterium]|jgi:hypothetical protein|nr:zinc ribbon domain-containing protein [Christensenellaceae bacterium]